VSTGFLTQFAANSQIMYVQPANDGSYRDMRYSRLSMITGNFSAASQPLNPV